MPVVYFGNGVFGGEQQILPDAQSVLHAGAGKAFNGLVQIMHAGYDAAVFEFMYQLTDLRAVFRSIDQFDFSGFFNGHLRGAVNVAVGVTG